MAGRLVEFAGWLATQVFDVVGSVAGIQGADGGATVDLQVGKTVHVVPAQVGGLQACNRGFTSPWHARPQLRGVRAAAACPSRLPRCRPSHAHLPVADAHGAVAQPAAS
jgi:hypothetical protein